MITFENEFYALGLSEATGAIERLRVKESGWDVIRQPKLAMGLRLLVPTPTIRNNPAESAFQRLARIRKTEDSLTLVWEKIQTKHVADLDIAITMTIRFVQRSIRFELELKNHCPYLVEEVWAPCLGGVREPFGEGPLHVYTLDSVANLGQTTLGERFYNELGYWGTDIPTMIRTYPDKSNHAPFELISNQTQGFYFGMHDDLPTVVHFIHEFRPGYVESRHSRVVMSDELDGRPAGYSIAAVKMPYVASGETRTLSPMVLEYFRGDYHKGLDIYRKERIRKLSFKPTPAWATQADCWLTLHMNSPENCLRYRYKDLLPVMIQAKEAGVMVLQLIGWAIGGQDGEEPYQDFDPILGTKDELIQAIADIEAIGIRVLLMCKFKWADQNTKRFREELANATVKDQHGIPIAFGGYSYQTLAQHMNGAARKTGVALCHLSENFQTIAKREFQKILSYRPSGILYDELNNHHMTTCFDVSHGHAYGESVMKGSVALAKMFYDMAIEQNPDFLFAAEGAKDHLTEIYQVNYIRSWFQHRPAWKYLDPHALIATCITGFDDREMINQCLTYGYILNYEPLNFKGTTTDIPKTVAYGQLARRLRKTLWKFLWEGIPQDPACVKLESSTPNIEFIHNVFLDTGSLRRAIVISNQSFNQRFEGKISMISGSTAYWMHRVETMETEESDGSFSIEPRSLIVLVEQTGQANQESPNHRRDNQ